MAIKFRLGLLCALVSLATPASARAVLGELWRVSLPAAGPPPAVTGELEIAVAAAATILRVDATSGTILGVTPLEDPIVELRADPRGIYAVTETSTLAWLTPAGRVTATVCLPASVLAVSADDQRLLISLADASLLAFDLRDHQLAWRTVLGLPVSAPPALTSDLIAVPTLDGLQFVRASDGVRVGGSKPERSTALAPTWMRGRFIVSDFDRRIAAVGAPKGGSAWRAEIGGGASAPPIATADRIYVTSAANQLLALKPNGSPAWRAPLDGRVTYVPTIWGTSVLVVPFRRPTLWGFDLESGVSSVRAQLTGAHPVFESGALTTDSIVILRGRDGDRRFLVGYGLERNEPTPGHGSDRGRSRGPRDGGQLPF